MGKLLGLCGFLLSWVATAAPLRSPDILLSSQKAEALAAFKFGGSEVEYQNQLHPQTIADLKLLYAPENATKVERVYASFSDETHPGDDGGFGLHVVRRLRLKDRTLYVNESWPTDRKTGALLLPDQIRVQMQIFEGPERVPGSEDTYLFDSLHLAWGPNGEVEMFRRSIHQSNHMRVPVSAPQSCQECHNAATSDDFAHLFLEKGEPRNYESIVSDSHFLAPLKNQRGFQRFLNHLENHGADPATLEKAREKLLDPEKFLELPGFFEALERNRTSRNWLSEDSAWDRKSYSSEHDIPFQQGTYWSGRGWLIDATEGIFEGKYRWWTPAVVVP